MKANNSSKKTVYDVQRRRDLSTRHAKEQVVSSAQGSGVHRYSYLGSPSLGSKTEERWARVWRLGTETTGKCMLQIRNVCNRQQGMDGTCM